MIEKPDITSKHIALEGVFKSGKAKLASLLAQKIGGKVILDKTENPYLKDFYDEKEGAAFLAQLVFLVNRYHQQVRLIQRDLFEERIFCDYIFEKDKIYAYQTLSDEELVVYERIYSVLAERVPKPDLVVYLQARPEVLYKRVKKRDKKYERSVTFEYLTEVAQAYNQFFFYYEETPLLVVNTSEIDFVASSKDLADLIKEINNMGLGTQHYIPLGSR